MKKSILLLVLFFISISALKSQTYRYIPDSSFRYYLRSVERLPFDSSGDSLAISSTSVTSKNYIDCSSRSIVSLEGIQYLVNLRLLYCSSNSLASLPSLPDSLRELSCEYNALVSLPSLPSSLTFLRCHNNSLTTLPSLPSRITQLEVNDNLLTSLPSLPGSLIYLDCSQNSLTALPSLPDSLTTLGCADNLLTAVPLLPSTLIIFSCAGNSLTSLPAMPSTLLTLSCGWNLFTVLPSLPSSLTGLDCRGLSLTSLPPLPSSLRDLDCRVNSLVSLPSLPSTLGYLWCYSNSLTSLPSLPNSLWYFDCSNNASLTCLPYLPRSLGVLYYDSAAISCLPNYVSGTYYYPPFITHPLCNPYVHSCPSYTALEGRTYFDNNSNCNFDAMEPGVGNVQIYFEHDTTLIQIVSSAFNGIYAVETLPMGIYSSHIDTSNIPFNVLCPTSGYDTITIDSAHLFYVNRNYALQCNTGFEVGSTGLRNTGIIRPARTASFDLHAGDMANIYGAHCTSISGMIELDYSGPMFYTGVAAGTLVPDSILPHRLVWNIADFSALDFYSAIKPNFFVDSSARIGDLVCFTTSVSPSAGDRVPSNNTFSQCFGVRTSYDPNYKVASPSGSVTATQDWMYYTIHFQNLGNSYAENIYVWDTIDTDLDLNTIQVIGASHQQHMQVFNANRSVRFNFLNIMLEDSSSNEPASHGWVQYRIKLKSGLPEGVNITNSASILFDLNAPVVTNTTSNRICNSPSNIAQSYTINSGQSIRVGTHTYTSSGVYTDVFNNINGCDSIVSTTLQVLSGIVELDALRIIFYPNPSNTLVNIQLEGKPTNAISIIDMYGRDLYRSNKIASSYQINTESWSDGTYIIQCGNSRGKLVVSH